MSSYVDEVLIKDEMVIYRGRLSLWSFFGWIFLGLILLIAVGIGLLVWLWVWLKYSSTELAVTNKRIIVKSGLIQRNTTEMFLEKVESIQVDQGIMGRMLDFGSITVSGTGGDKSPVNNVAHPIEFRKAFMTAVDANRK
ncbi:MAG: PH domain-containing protein [Burkholderiales bacterium]